MDLERIIKEALEESGRRRKRAMTNLDFVQTLGSYPYGTKECEVERNHLWSYDQKSDTQFCEMCGYHPAAIMGISRFLAQGFDEREAKEWVRAGITMPDIAIQLGETDQIPENVREYIAKQKLIKGTSKQAADDNPYKWHIFITSPVLDYLEDVSETYSIDTVWEPDGIWVKDKFDLEQLLDAAEDYIEYAESGIVNLIEKALYKIQQNINMGRKKMFIESSTDLEFIRAEKTGKPYHYSDTYFVYKEGEHVGHITRIVTTMGENILRWEIGEKNRRWAEIADTLDEAKKIAIRNFTYGR